MYIMYIYIHTYICIYTYREKEQLKTCAICIQMAGQGRRPLLGDVPLLRQEDHRPRLLRHDGGHQEGWIVFSIECVLYRMCSL